MLNFGAARRDVPRVSDEHRCSPVLFAIGPARFLAQPLH
jgi:hypothetical protein